MVREGLPESDCPERVVEIQCLKSAYSPVVPPDRPSETEALHSVECHQALPEAMVVSKSTESDNHDKFNQINSNTTDSTQ